MGASQWSEWAEWKGNVEKTLRAIREEVFQSGNYYLAPSRAKPPKTIAALLRRNEDSGAHSILDITAIATVRGHGVAAPLTEDQLDALFGTTTPTRAQVDAEAELLALIRPRGEGAYVIAYEHGAPVGVYFVGVTGH